MSSEVRQSSLGNHEACLKYFNEFLPGILGKLLMEDLNRLNCRIDIAVTDSDEEAWALEIEAGRLTSVGHEGIDAQCRFVLDTQTLLDVVGARIEPDRAFFDMRIDITGDVALGLQLSTVLRAFFKQFPFSTQP